MMKRADERVRLHRLVLHQLVPRLMCLCRESMQRRGVHGSATQPMKLNVLLLLCSHVRLLQTFLLTHKPRLKFICQRLLPLPGRRRRGDRRGRTRVRARVPFWGLRLRVSQRVSQRVSVRSGATPDQGSELLALF